MRPVTRREVLAGITAAGTAGAVSGVGTAAMLADRETLANAVASGRVELRVDAGDGPTDAVDGPIALPFPALSPGDAGHVDLSLLVPDEDGVNPAYLWVRAGCAGPSSLVDALRLSVTHATGAGETLFEGTYGAFLHAFRDGVPLDASGRDRPAGSQSCLDPGTTVPLAVGYELADDYVGDETATILLEAVAVQCRRVDAAARPPAFDTPLGVADCEAEGEAPCDCCLRVGKYELNGTNELDEGTVPFTEGSDAYLLTVADVEENGDGEATAARFGIVLASEPSTAVDVCRIEVKTGGGRDGTDVFVYVDEETDGVVGTDGKGISHVTVSVCAPRVDDGDGPRCPEDLLRDPSLDDRRGGRLGEGAGAAGVGDDDLEGGGEADEEKPTGGRGDGGKP